MTAELRHPIFARYFAFMARGADRVLAPHWRELLEGVAGEVIEVGAGTGGTFPYYPRSVVRVVAVEPEPYLRQKAEEAAEGAPVPVRVLAGVAEQLPVEDASFDAAVVSLVLCSVRDQRRALAELRRVVRPGGELRFYEHVRAEEGALVRVQPALDHVWPRLAGGCHTSRDTIRAIEEAGFRLERARRFRFQPTPLAWPASPSVIGAARRP